MAASLPLIGLRSEAASGSAASVRLIFIYQETISLKVIDRTDIFRTIFGYLLFVLRRSGDLTGGIMDQKVRWDNNHAVIPTYEWRWWFPMLGPVIVLTIIFAISH